MPPIPDHRRRAEYPIRAVSKLTGIAIDTLRAWERRYHAVTPARDAGRGRLYTRADVTRLRLIHEAVTAGHRIGRVARLRDAELRRLAASPTPSDVPGRAIRPSIDASLFRDALLRLDGTTIDREFSRLAALLPPLELVRDVLLPVLREIGDAWNRHRGGIAHEHLISGMIRHLLGSMLRLHTSQGTGPALLFATPAGDRHEIGILGAAMLAASRGCSVSYLGPDLPAQQIVDAVKSAKAHVLVLGLTMADDGTQRQRELQSIARRLPPHVEMWVGGPAARGDGTRSRRARTLQDLDEYVAHLTQLSHSGPDHG